LVCFDSDSWLLNDYYSPFLLLPYWDLGLWNGVTPTLPEASGIDALSDEFDVTRAIFTIVTQIHNIR